jgi:basic amino acid/polyamine antiporter, APA family
MKADPSIAKPQLIRGLTFTHAVALVVGTVIGTGVFLKAAIMAQAVGSPVYVLAAWLVAGLMSLAGALTYAELGALLPHAGGEYNYLREAYGNGPAFLYGWMRIVVGSSGSIAALAAGFAAFLATVFPTDAVWVTRQFTFLGQTVNWQFGMRQVTAVAIILVLSGINCIGVALGGKIQTFLTALKVSGILFIVFGVFFFSKGSHGLAVTEVASKSWNGFAAFGAAMLAALWAYEGWNQMPMVSAEVQQPERNVPRALVTGMFLVVLLYLLANAAYLWVLPFGEIVNANSTQFRTALPVAAKAAQTFMGSMGPRLVSIIFLVSAIGALNGTILLCARVPYAMARDGFFFSRFAKIGKTSRVPTLSIVIQAVWASILAISGTYDQLTDYVVFASWLFYVLVTTSVFVLRRRMVSARPYKTPGYPFTPIMFILVASWLILNTLRTRPLESTVGIVLIALGIPIYLYFNRRGVALARLGTDSGQ